MYMFEVNNLNAGYGGSLILKDISFSIKKDTILGIIGPNGSGKSTLLRVLTGLIPHLSGTIKFKNKNLSSYSRKALARTIAVLEQEGTPPLPFTVEEIVAMGRYPWLIRYASLSKEDELIIDEVLTSLNLTSKRKKTVNSLSGGERQMVSLARALVQKPEVLVLDEPTTYLDIGNQLQVMEYIRVWQQRNNLTVIMVLHDLNITSQYCKEVLLMNQGSIYTWGSLTDVLNEENITQVYRTPILKINHPTLGVPQFLLANC